MHRRGIFARSVSNPCAGIRRTRTSATSIFGIERAFMTRISWFDEKTHMPVIDEQVHKLSTFVDAMADGVIDDAELEKQQESVVAAMKAVESELSDDQHAKITRLMGDLSAYNIMRLLHELPQPRLERTLSLG